MSRPRNRGIAFAVEQQQNAIVPLTQPGIVRPTEGRQTSSRGTVVLVIVIIVQALSFILFARLYRRACKTGIILLHYCRRLLYWSTHHDDWPGEHHGLRRHAAGGRGLQRHD
jgi:hypothetical protein